MTPPTTPHDPPRMDVGDEGPDPRGNLERGDDSPTGGMDLEPFLEAGGFPVRKGDLVERAERAGAPAHVRELLDRLPEREYRDVLDISREIGGTGAV